MIAVCLGITSQQGKTLTICPTDPKSGLEADQKVIAAHGCYAMTATTALTAQNTQGVYDIHQVPPGFLRKQIDACLDDIGADVVKTGMLASTETIEVVAERLGATAGATAAAAAAKETALRLVLDPVMIATTGAALLPSSALKQLREKLLPLATVITPNVPEARLLLQDAWGGKDLRPVESVEDLEEMARLLLTMVVAEQGDQDDINNNNKKGPQWVLVKGGHTPFRRRDMKVAHTSEEKEVVVDVLVGRKKGGSRDDTVVRIETEWLESRNTHGTGCSLACE